MDNVCNRRLFSFPAKVEMAEEQEYLGYLFLDDRKQNFYKLLLINTDFR